MKKIYLILCLGLVFLNISPVNWYWECSSYWAMAIYNYNWTCSCMKGYFFWILAWQKYCISWTTYCYDNYWYNSEYSYLSDSCKCRDWYSVKTNILWNQTCVSTDSLCQNEYWWNAEWNDNGTCSCRAGYSFKDNAFWGWKTCVSFNTICSDKFGFNSTYNSLTKSCECSYWYDFTKKTIWDWYECQSCTSKHWTNSKYNSVSKSCECKTWYTLKDWKCEEKSNSAYFYLNEYNDSNNEAIITSYATKKRYHLELKYITLLYKAEEFVGKSIVINMWTDFTVDKNDYFVLNNQNTTTDIETSILRVEEVDNNFTLKTCDEIYWDNSIDLGNEKCWCKGWYEWNTTKTECIITKKSNTPNDYVYSDSYTYAKKLTKAGIIKTVLYDTDYRLRDNITRAELAKLVSNIAWLDWSKCDWNIFSDVNSNLWDLCWYIEAVANAWYVNKSNSNFRPKDLITKAEAMKMILNAWWIKSDNNSAGFYDVDWSIGDLYWYINAWKNKWYLLDEGNYFYPKSNATRDFVFKVSSYLIK